MGYGLAYTEMVSSKGLFFNDEKTKLLLNTENEQIPVAAQIFGNDIEAMKFAAQQVSKIAPIIDINMGCPAPKVVKNGDGSKLLLNLELAENIIETVVKNSTVPVTLKIRKGWDENNIVAVELAKEGKKVTIIEVMDQFLALPSAVIPAYQMAVEQAGVKVITGHRLDYVDHDQAIIVDRFGNKKELKADGGIVISAGFMPQLELQEKLEEETDIEVYTVGDAKKVRQIIDATHEGYAVARMI